MITFGEELKSATNVVHPKIQHNRLTLDILSTLQSSDFLVSKHPFRIEMKNITPQDVTIMSNLDIPVVDKKIKHIIVELLQNIVIKQSQKHAKKSHFVLEQKDDTLHIEVSNYLENVINGNDKIGEITRRIEEVNSMDTQEIKELYREKLGDAKFTETGG